MVLVFLPLLKSDLQLFPSVSETLLLFAEGMSYSSSTYFIQRSDCKHISLLTTAQSSYNTCSCIPTEEHCSTYSMPFKKSLVLSTAQMQGQAFIAIPFTLQASLTIHPSFRFSIASAQYLKVRQNAAVYLKNACSKLEASGCLSKEMSSDVL